MTVQMREARQLRSAVCVVIPHYGDEANLLASIRSIVEDVLVDVIVVDDGNPVPLKLATLEQACTTNVRVLLFSLDRNQGIEAALNQGLRVALACGYAYIGRLDSGDTVVANRFVRQRKYMDEHALDVCGTWTDFVTPAGERLFTLRHPIEHAQLISAIKVYNPFVHPSVMMRRDYVMQNGFYPVDFPALEDWAYFMRGRRLGKMGNVPEVMTTYVVSPCSVSSRRRLTQSMSKLKLQLAYFEFNRASCLGLLRSMAAMLFSRNALTLLKRSVHGHG